MNKKQENKFIKWFKLIYGDRPMSHDEEYKIRDWVSIMREKLSDAEDQLRDVKYYDAHMHSACAAWNERDKS